MDEAESKYLGALVKLGVTRKQAEESVQTYGITEDLLNNRVTDEAIARAPAVVEKRIAREKAQQNLARQRTLTQRGAGTTQELENAENDYRTAVGRVRERHLHGPHRRRRRLRGRAWRSTRPSNRSRT